MSTWHTCREVRVSFIDTLLSAKLPLSGSSTYSIQSYLQSTFVQHSPVFLPIAWPAHSPFQRTCFPRCNLLLCATLCHPMGCSPPGASDHGISQARILEWAATSSSRGSSRPGDSICISRTGRRVPHHWATRGAQADPVRVLPVDFSAAVGKQAGSLPLAEAERCRAQKDSSWFLPAGEHNFHKQSRIKWIRASQWS